jgi:hypothetical protein
LVQVEVALVVREVIQATIQYFLLSLQLAVVVADSEPVLEQD